MAQGRHFSASRSDSRRPRSEGPRYRDDRRSGGRRPSKPREERVPELDFSLDAPAFAELGLPQPLTVVLANLEITQPFPIQAATIPDALAGRDVLGRGRTGSGKTLAFGLPMLTRLMGEKSRPKFPRAMVLVPTRELAMQVRDALTPLAHQAKLSMQLVIGGASYQRQIEGFQRGADIVVATPGRLIDLVNQRSVDLSEVQIAVLDEADQMADMGFMDEVKELMDQVAKDGQRLLFSATLDRGIDQLVKNYLRDPVEHATDPETASVSTMTHHLFVVDAREKPAIVHNIAKREGRTICFARTQLGVEQWADEFADLGIRVEALHGGKSQAARAKAITNFKEGKVDLLIATDVAARGIHVDDVDLVLQIDPPRDPKDYLHRAGRTARAGNEGSVVLIATTRQVRSAENMLRQAGVEAIDKRVHAGDEYIADVTGAREEYMPRKRTTHLKEEQRVRRATMHHDDDLSFAERREARPRTARVDDHRFAPRRSSDRFESRGERPERRHFSSRRDERPSFGQERRYDRDDRRGDRYEDRRSFSSDRDRRFDDRPRRDDRFDDRRSFSSDRDRRFDDRPRRDDRFDDRRGGRFDDRRSFSSDRDRRFDGSDRPRHDDRGTAERRDRTESSDRRTGRSAQAERPARPTSERAGKNPTNRKRTDKPRWKAADKKAARGKKRAR